LQLCLEITSLKEFHDTVRFCVKKSSHTSAGIWEILS